MDGFSFERVKLGSVHTWVGGSVTDSVIFAGKDRAMVPVTVPMMEQENRLYNTGVNAALCSAPICLMGSIRSLSHIFHHKSRTKCSDILCWSHEGNLTDAFIVKGSIGHGLGCVTDPALHFVVLFL